MTFEIHTALTRMLGIRHPIIMAPMFLVSDENMVIEATKNGITGAIPALNYRTDKDFRKALEKLQQECEGPFGINLIANKSNFRLKEQLQSCLDYKVDFIITSLGNPQHIIDQCHQKDIKVFCDVIDEKYGKKVIHYEPDALIAVNKDAGGHAGYLPAGELVRRLKAITDIPVITAGGVGNGRQLYQKLQERACGVSMGSIFIATEESPVSKEYKEACVHYGAKDIVMTTKLSGTPCTVINTPYVQKTGTKQNPIEAFLNKNRRMKKIAKSITFYKGMKLLKKAAFTTTYQSVWCAGPSIEYVHAIKPVKVVVQELIEQYQHTVEENKHEKIV